MDKEVDLGRIAGPFSSPPFPNLKVSPIGLVPKSDGGWRLIQHLSYLKDHSINDGIDDKYCSVKYTSFDKVANMIFTLGRGAQIAKRDIKSAFRLLPIHPDDFHLLGMKVGKSYYFDRMLPIGCARSCSLFETFSSFLHWLIEYLTGINSLDHYLDDFIFGSEKSSGSCMVLIDCVERVYTELGVPIAHEKSVGPTTVLTFLGLDIDTVAMTIRVPAGKIQELTNLLRQLLCKKKISLLQLQSLVGKLNFFSRRVVEHFYGVFIRPCMG
ncbi:uncharacterized protein LOC128548992 [Mercenaria mercenaria]|uniref:uncharacterized protein LOC128548992 n=1 Tax=Mercenaria mercenaria TaxID=6596 RepID=UPI00234FA688|nr:uncharacterized protein LOC128548992 [Mercenaria mercenaria]